MLPTVKLEEKEEVVSEYRKAQLREAQRRRRQKMKEAGIVARTFELPEEAMEHAEKIKLKHDLPSLDAAVAYALKDTAGRS